MRIQTAVISTKELQDALRIYCADNGGIPGTVIIQSYAKQIVVSLDPAGGVVLDPFMGSGTTAAVAVLNGRDYLGCELNPAYKELQDARIKEAFLENAQMELI